MAEQASASPDDESPDPSDLEPITSDEAVFQRDEAGDLIPQAQAIKTTDGWRRIEIVPTPKGEAIRFEERFGGRDDLEIEDLDELLNEKVTQPAIDWSNDDIKPGVYLPVLNAVIESIIGETPTNQFHAEVREELAQRGAEGN